jgi:hypothetical protein
MFLPLYFTTGQEKLNWPQGVQAMNEVDAVVFYVFDCRQTSGI